MLEGTLKEFALPDVFQLLAYTKKTGCLAMRQEGHEGEVYFKDGEVYFAMATTSRLALGKRLVGAGLLSTASLEQALDEQRGGAGGLRLGEILVNNGAIDRETLELFVREQIQDAVFDLMRWSDGGFSFDAASEVDEGIVLSVSVENLIMEGSRRLEEWDSVRKKIAGPQAIVAMAPVAPQGTVEVNLKPDEWHLLTMVDGRRTVSDLVELFGQGEFSTCRLLFGLVGAGLLEVRDPDLEGPTSIAALLQQQELLRKLEAEDETARGKSGPPAVSARPGRFAPTDVPEDDVALDVAPPARAEPAPEPPPRRPEPPQPAEPRVPLAPAAIREPERTPALAGVGASSMRSRRTERRITTDPEVDAVLVRRLIDGVKSL